MKHYSEQQFENEIISSLTADDGDQPITEKKKQELLGNTYQTVKNFYNSSGMANQLGKAWNELTKDEVLSVENAMKENQEQDEQKQAPKQTEQPKQEAPEQSPVEKPEDDQDESEE